MEDDDKTRKFTPKPDHTRAVDRLQRPAAGKAAEPDTQPKTRVAARSAPAPSGKEGTSAYDLVDRPVVGWLVVVSGPGRGQFAPLFDGINSIGRGDDQIVQLDFGDDTISRSTHAYVAYDPTSRRFTIQMAGRPIIVRLNGMAVLQTSEMKNSDRITIGKTELAFVAFCGENFDWQEPST